MDILSPATAAAAAVLRPEGRLVPFERRGDKRFMSVLRVGKIVSGDREELCMIRNISAGGLMAHVYAGFEPEQPVAIEIRNGHVQTGRVAWFNEMMMGVEFNERIDVLDFLATEQESLLNGYIPRAPRLHTQVQGLVRRGAEYLRIRMIDISQGGAKLSTSVPLQADDDVVLTLRDLPPIQATVRWSDEDRAGLSFHEFMPFETLAQWIVERGPVLS